MMVTAAPDQREQQHKQPESREPLSRERIIAAAVELLDESGLKGLTMRALGEQLGVEAMALYHYFPSKQALLEAAGNEVDLSAFFGKVVGRPTTGRSAADIVVELGMRYLRFAHENPSQFALLFCVIPIQYASLGGVREWRLNIPIPPSRLPERHRHRGVRVTARLRGERDELRTLGLRAWTGHASPYPSS